MLKIEQRAVIKFLTKESIGYLEITARLKKVYKDAALKESTVRKWAKEFKRCRESFEDDPRCGRPAAAHCEEKVAEIEKLVVQNRRIKC